MNITQFPSVADHAPRPCDISIVIPCLNELEALPFAINNAQFALGLMRRDLALTGEIVVADNGSTDGSQDLARDLGARVVDVPVRGYGAALIGGFTAAQGRFLVMGDADGSYDFTDAVAMVAELLKGADLAMGSRFLGGIAPGAMPWKNRYIGNPILTGILNLLYGARIGDAHCGIRALTKPCFEKLRLSGTGMEFASEMIIKAALLKVRMVEVPAKLLPDRRGRPPHLRPWRDGWRHLRYLLMLSPGALFGWPALIGGLAGIGILSASAWYDVQNVGLQRFIGNYWTVLGGALLTISHMAGLFALAAQIYAIREGYRRPGPIIGHLRTWLTLEVMLFGGVVLMAAGLAELSVIASIWKARAFLRFESVFPAVLGTSLIMLGVQSMMGGFMLAVISGNNAKFLGDGAFAPPAQDDNPDRLTGT
jgi:glycosyltransferase involved in cell wall biosynthesis